MSLFPKNLKKSKSGDISDSVLCSLCKEGLLDTMLDEYIYFCRHGGNSDIYSSERTSVEASGHSSTAKKAKSKGLFPNIAGFCRFMRAGVGEFESLSRLFPQEYQRALSVFEDEALNSDISSATLSSYMKNRLFYERTSPSRREASSSDEVRVCFEHDIFGDGE